MNTSKFSNGHTDVYKGRRDVKAAWMIIFPNGHISSGHSLDRARAEKTARNNAAEGRRGEASWYNVRNAHVGYHAMRTKRAREKGYNSFKEWLDAERAATADFVADCIIEIVDL